MGLSNTNAILKPYGLSVRWRDSKKRKIGVIRHQPNYWIETGKERTLSIGVFTPQTLFKGLSTPTWDRGSPTGGNIGWDLDGAKYDNGMDYTPPSFTAAELASLAAAIALDKI